jgi:hypothetical protein
MKVDLLNHDEAAMVGDLKSIPPRAGAAFNGTQDRGRE